MSIDRRFVLKGMSLSGMATVAIGNSTSALGKALFTSAPAPKAVLALVNGSAAEPLFLHGALAVNDANLQVQRLSHDLGSILELGTRMRTGQPLHIIGLLDDAAATLVVDTARSAGARVQWLGQHSAVAGAVHHRLLATDMVNDCARRLGWQLQVCGAEFGLLDERATGALSMRESHGQLSQSVKPVLWAASLGYLLASLNAFPESAPAPAPALTPATLPPAANAPVTGNFVSFSIDVPGSPRNG